MVTQCDVTKSRNKGRYNEEHVFLFKDPSDASIWNTTKGRKTKTKISSFKSTKTEVRTREADRTFKLGLKRLEQRIIRLDQADRTDPGRSGKIQSKLYYTARLMRELGKRWAGGRRRSADGNDGKRGCSREGGREGGIWQEGRHVAGTQSRRQDEYLELAEVVTAAISSRLFLDDNMIISSVHCRLKTAYSRGTHFFPEKSIFVCREKKKKKRSFFFVRSIQIINRCDHLECIKHDTE